MLYGPGKITGTMCMNEKYIYTSANWILCLKLVLSPFMTDQIRKHKKEKKTSSPNRVETSKSSETAVKRMEVPEVPRLVPVPIEEETHEWLGPATEAATSDVRLSFNDESGKRYLFIEFAS